MYPSIPTKLEEYHKDGYKLVDTETLIPLLSVVLGKFYNMTVRMGVTGSSYSYLV